jgi:hypothetical protein
MFEENYIPLNLVIDQNMIIRYRDTGYSESEVEEMVQQYISP